MTQVVSQGGMESGEREGENPDLFQLYEMYTQDRIIVHSIPVPRVRDRAAAFKQDPDTLKCGSLLFFEGMHNKASGLRLPNAVARLGDPLQVNQTVFGSIHDMERVWRTHEELERAKPLEKRGKPFVYFTNCDMCDVAAECGGQPCWKYTDAQFQVTPPASLQRTRSFNFRFHCEKALENEATKDNKRKPGRKCEWNELRAALNNNNAVGLVYISDPSHDPREHIDDVERLQQDLGLPDLCCAVFELDNPKSVTGRILVTDEAKKADVDVDAASGTKDLQPEGADLGRGQASTDLAAHSPLPLSTAGAVLAAHSRSIKEVERHEEESDRAHGLNSRGSHGRGGNFGCNSSTIASPAKARKRLVSYGEYVAGLRSELAA